MSSFGRPLIQPVLQFFDSNGNPLAGGSLSTYAAGTSTPQATYSDSALSTPLPNPITLNSQGMPQTGAGSVTVIYLSSNSYKFVLADSGATTIWTADNIGGSVGVDAAGTAFTGTTGTFSGLVDISASTAGQITFPAIQHSSSNANTLDDYQEQSWTPTISNLGHTGGAPTITGSYRKIGSVVLFTIRIVPVSSTTSTANSTASTLPVPTSMPGMAAVFASSDNVASFGVGFLASNGIFFPSWSNITQGVNISGFYFA